MPPELIQKPNSIFYIEGTVHISGKSERIRETTGWREEQVGRRAYARRIAEVERHLLLGEISPQGKVINIELCHSGGRLVAGAAAADHQPIGVGATDDSKMAPTFDAVLDIDDAPPPGRAGRDRAAHMSSS
jgi:hypothetical protein